MKGTTLLQLIWFSVLMLTSCQLLSQDQGKEEVRNDADGIYEMNPNTVSNPPAAEKIDGRIVFVSYRDGNAEIYVMKEDGSEQTRLTNHAVEDSAPSWSPDGQQIVFVSDRGGGEDLYIMNADGSQLRRLIEIPGWKGYPKWSPDGKQIAFNVSGRDGPRINILTLETGEIRQVPADDYEASRPSWSSDSQYLLFSSGKDHMNVYLNELYLVSLIDGNVRQVSNLEEGNTFVTPVLSPDGERVLFRFPRGPDAGVFHIELQGITPLVYYVAGIEPRAKILEGGQINPNWSPDGQHVVFVSGKTTQVNIHTLNLESGEVKQLTDSPANDLSPDWWQP